MMPEMLLKHLALLLYSGQLILGGWQQATAPTPRGERPGSELAGQ